MHKYFTLILTVICLKVIDAQFKSCTDYDGKRGRCVPIIACHFLLHLESRTNQTYADSLVLEKSYCAPPSGGLTFVCCEETGGSSGSTTTARPSRGTTRRGYQKTRPSRANRRIKTTEMSGGRFTIKNDFYSQKSSRNYGETTTRRNNYSTERSTRNRTTTRRNNYSTEISSRDKTTTRRYDFTTERSSRGRETTRTTIWNYFDNEQFSRERRTTTTRRSTTTRRQENSFVFGSSSERKSNEQGIRFPDESYGGNDRRG